VRRAALLLAAIALALVAGSTPAQAAPARGFAVPDGDYRLVFLIGSATRAAQTGIRVEARRTVLAPVETAPGQFVISTVTVNVRTPESMPDGQEGPGTPGLQVYPTGNAPALDNVWIFPVRKVPHLFVISDSTAADWLTGPKRGWAQEIPRYFRAGISVANYADSGSSTVSWLADPTLFATVEPLIHPGDEVLIQLAHNDKTTTEADYRANLTTLVSGVRKHGGLPVLVTPPVRHLFDATGLITPTGRIVNNLGVDLPAVMRSLAGQSHTPLLDLTADSQRLMQTLGPDRSLALYVGTQATPADATHFTEFGATVIAGLVASELREARLPAEENLYPNPAPPVV